MIKLSKLVLFALASVAFAAGLSGSNGTGSGSLFSEAEARIGRPLTPMSYAGVARRTTRRAVAVGAAGAAGVYYGSSCVQVVDAYGRVTTRC
ncbi:hypothetical protein ACQR1H_23985 [Bradyrhizobium sp. HKCCYLRH2015]|uniref:hypothetical protein n=1 Tax=Bradyrhizobium TaxID=374 RepID=UPI003EBAE132